MKAALRKFVEWRDEDSVYVGYCPELFIGGTCHGPNKRKVYVELCRLVADDLQLRRETQTHLN
jgi:hypothetical protein